MKVYYISFFLLILSVTFAPAQTRDESAVLYAQQLRLKKQIIADDIHLQLKDVRFAGVRTFVRLKLASWLWKKGNDDTGLGELLVREALDDLFANKAEIPESYFDTLRSDLFGLLEIHNKQAAKKLIEKYGITSEDELLNANSILNKKGGERIAADKIIGSFAGAVELASMSTWMMEELSARKSPELLRVLSQMVAFEETGRSNFSVNSLFFAVDYFRNESIPNELKQRFLRMIVNKVKAIFQSQTVDSQATFDLLDAVKGDIASVSPDLLPVAATLHAILLARIPKESRMLREIYERIEDSSDRLEALISEADKTDAWNIKQSLLTNAARLSLKKEKFVLAIDLLGRIKEGVLKEGKKENKTFLRWHDQFLGDVLQRALKKSDLESANLASTRIIDRLIYAETLRQLIAYHTQKLDAAAAGDALDLAIRVLQKEPNDSRKAGILIRFIPTVQKFDVNRISEVTEATAKTISGMESLNTEDEPDSEKYKRYVASIMAIDYNLLPVITDLFKKNRNEAANFGSRLNRKEVRIVSDLATLTAGLDAESEIGKLTHPNQ